MLLLLLIFILVLILIINCLHIIIEGFYSSHALSSLLEQENSTSCFYALWRLHHSLIWVVGILHLLFTLLWFLCLDLMVFCWFFYVGVYEGLEKHFSFFIKLCAYPFILNFWFFFQILSNIECFYVERSLIFIFFFMLNL